MMNSAACPYNVCRRSCTLRSPIPSRLAKPELRREAVTDRVLEQGLQQQRGNGFVARGVATRELHAQPLSEANLFDVEVLAGEVQFFVERGILA